MEPNPTQIIADDVDMLKNSILTIISNAKASNELSQETSKQLSEIAAIVEHHAQFIINTNQKVKMLMQYLNIDYKDVVNKYDSSKDRIEIETLPNMTMQEQMEAKDA